MSARLLWSMFDAAVTFTDRHRRVLTADMVPRELKISLWYAEEPAECRVRNKKGRPFVRGREEPAWVEVLHVERWEGGLPPGSVGELRVGNETIGIVTIGSFISSSRLPVRD